MTILLMFVAFWLGTAFWLDRVGQRASHREAYGAIVVAGCRVQPGGTPSMALRRRVDLAVALYQKGIAPRVLFTGGVGDYPPSEASAAADYALSLGLPFEAIALEEHSTSTEENALFAAEALGEISVLVVSDAYHSFRARKVFRHYFPHVDTAGTVGGPRARIFGSLREVVAVAGYLLLPRSLRSSGSP